MAFGFFLFAGIYENIEYLLRAFVSPAHMLRMPLDTQEEGMGGMHHSFHDPVLTDGAYFQILSQSIHSLMVDAVDGEAGLFDDGFQRTAGQDIDPVAAGAAAFKIGMAVDVLVEGAALKDVQHLNAPADAQNRKIPLHRQIDDDTLLPIPLRSNDYGII